MARFWTASAVKLEDVDAYLVSCGDKLKVEVTCREFVRLVSSVLLYPLPDNMTGSAVILMKTEEKKVSSIPQTAVAQKLKEHGFEVGIKIEANYELFINCYRFTAIARLAPKWNAAGNWLVQGTDFLSHDRGNVLRFDVIASSDATSLFLKVESIKFFPIQVDDLDISAVTLSSFKKQHCLVITEYSICSNQCFVLPSLAEAYVYSVSHQIPSSSEFSTYDGLRLNWKKKHGIILPEKPGLYYQVFFTSNPENIMTYPECCVYKSQPIFYPCRVIDSVASAFIGDINTRFHLVCGQSVSYSPASVPNVSLCSNNFQLRSNWDPTSSAARILHIDTDKNPKYAESPCIQQLKFGATSLHEECTSAICSENSLCAQAFRKDPIAVKSHAVIPNTCQQQVLVEPIESNSIKVMRKKVLKTKVSTLRVASK